MFGMNCGPGLLTRFARDRRAVSAVEFALSLPFLLLLYVGGIDLSQAVSADRKVTLLARTVSDLVSQSSSLTDSDVSNIFGVSTGVLYPLALNNANGVSKLKLKVSQVWTMPQGSGTLTKVDWSIARNTTADTKNATVTIPDPALYKNADGTYNGAATVIATVTYTYTPPVTIGLIGPMTMTKAIYTRPRLSECVRLDDTDCGAAAHTS